MDRLDFLKTVIALPLIYNKDWGTLSALDKSLNPTERMPLLFLGHGSPMNAIEENEFVKGFRDISTKIPTPQAILCISAHWLTKGTKVTAMPFPKTIHDFGGFPKELFQVQYPAKGDLNLAKETKELIKTTNVELDESWGLDHGAWSVLIHLYPKATIPVIQLSLDYSKSPSEIFHIMSQLQKLRDKGVLIVGSGNIVHNLRLLDFRNMNKVDYGYDWAIEAHQLIHQLIIENQTEKLIDYQKLGKAVQLAVPSPDHYLPFLSILALKTKNDTVELFNDKLLGGSLTMTSLYIH